MASQQRITIIGIGAAIVALLLLTIGMHNIDLQPGNLSLPRLMPQALGAASATTALPTLPGWVSLLIPVILVLFVIALIVSPSLRRDLLRNIPVYILFAIGIYFIYSAAYKQQAPMQQGGPAPETIQEPPLGQAAPQIPEIVQHPPEWLIWLVLVLVTLAIATVLVLIARRLRPRRSEIDLIVDEAREALETIRAGGDLRDTITRAYAEMLRLFTEQRGMAQDRTLTPREFEQRLASAGLQNSHIRRLTRLFEMVRYSQRSPGPREEREAEECLSAIVSAYQQKQ